MDPGHLWTALRYAELNPVRAGIAAEAEAWPWSSAAAHCGTTDADACLEMSTWRKAWCEASWRKFLEGGETPAELLAIRRSTSSGRPMGPTEFIHGLEQLTLRRLMPRKGGRPRKTTGKENPQVLLSQK